MATWWVFANQSDAQAAADACTAALPPDKRDGSPVEPRITTAWAEVAPTLAGGWGFLAMPGRPLPAGATAVNTDPFPPPADE